MERTNALVLAAARFGKKKIRIAFHAQTFIFYQ